MNTKSKRKLKVLVIMLISVCFLSTGCTKTLVGKDNKAVKNEVTGQNLTENILCKPTNKETIKAYKKNKVNIDKLPECDNFQINSGKYEGLWTTIFVKPLAFILILLGKLINNYALSLIIISLIIRLLLYPVNKKRTTRTSTYSK